MQNKQDYHCFGALLFDIAVHVFYHCKVWFRKTNQNIAMFTKMQKIDTVDTVMQWLQSGQQSWQQYWLPTLTTNLDYQPWQPILTTNLDNQSWLPILTTNVDYQCWLQMWPINVDYVPMSTTNVDYQCWLPMLTTNVDYLWHRWGNLRQYLAKVNQF